MTEIRRRLSDFRVAPVYGALPHFFQLGDRGGNPADRCARCWTPAIAIMYSFKRSRRPRRSEAQVNGNGTGCRAYRTLTPYWECLALPPLAPKGQRSSRRSDLAHDWSQSGVAQFAHRYFKRIRSQPKRKIPVPGGILMVTSSRSPPSREASS